MVYFDQKESRGVSHGEDILEFLTLSTANILGSILLNIAKIPIVSSIPSYGKYVSGSYQMLLEGQNHHDLESLLELYKVINNDRYVSVV
jgi:hypothetical protein